MWNQLDKALELLFKVLIISVPLAIWKVIDICIWIYNHVDVSLK
jgi:hypothetical protein